MIKTKIIYGCEADGGANEAYMTRITFFEKPWGQLCLHIIHRSDWARDLHDHPWNFISLVLWRGYYEISPKSRKRKFPFMLLFRRATWIHRVELIKNKPAITLVFMFKKLRNWGFHTKAGWMNAFRYGKENGC